MGRLPKSFPFALQCAQSIWCSAQPTGIEGGPRASRPDSQRKLPARGTQDGRFPRRRSSEDLYSRPNPLLDSRCRTAMGIAGKLRRVETGAILPPSRRGRGVLILPRRRAFWPVGGLSCALLGRREAAVLQRRCPPSCAPRTFSAWLSGRCSVGCGNRGRLQRGYSKGPKRAPCSSACSSG